ncbi:hypothetical protein CEP45_02805 [Mergibacter septicus]|uniref:DUF4870 family protein n=1 Tax=Mergibacter septicus TaxID=221402 RepID=UPI001C7590EA|nr:hypothetical protein [Mergibacter septicus]QDJ12838.1 hypothetical protein CEP45_02805 [Mergibacter septicus]
MQDPIIQRPDNSGKMITIVYWLNIGTIFIQVLSIIGVIIAYVYRGNLQGTYLESHATYQIRTFWLSLLYSVISVFLCIIFIGYILLLLTFIWYIVRNVKGLMALNKAEPIIDSQTWLF